MSPDSVRLIIEACTPVHTENFIKTYQDLIAGILALIGALIGASFINGQIVVQREQEAVRRARRQAAARAVMPHVLMSLGDYASKVVMGLQDARRTELELSQFQPDRSPRMAHVDVKLPSLPKDLIRDFAEMIEATDEKDAQPFVALLSDIQVQVARVAELNIVSDSNIPNAKLREHELLLRMWDAVYLHAAASALFAYARQEPGAAAVKPDWDMMELSARTVRLSDYGDFSELLARKRENDPQPTITSRRPGTY